MLSDLLHHRRASLLDQATDSLARSGRTIARRPYSTTGLIVLALTICGFIWLYPELRRYIQIKRM